jgi:site-specific DNA-methyltransferase (adenine-specific)
VIKPYYSDEWVTLLHGDSLALLANLDSDSVDAVVTDPPYSSGGQFRGDRMGSTAGKYGGENFVDFHGDNRDQRAFLAWMGVWLGEVLRIAKPGAPCLLFTDWRQLPTMTDALQVGGWTWRGVVPWVKSGSRPAFKQRAFLNVCEFVVWGTAGSSTTEDGSTVPLPGFYQCPAPRDRDHQTQKPVEVMRELVKIVPPDGVILDPFMGSGTTGVAAMIEGRRFIGCEMVEHYAQVAERRIREAQGQSVERPGGSVSFDFGAA